MEIVYEPTMFDMVFNLKSCVRAWKIVRWRSSFSNKSSNYDAITNEIYQRLHRIFDWLGKNHRATTAGAYTIQSTYLDLLFSTDNCIVKRIEHLLGEASLHSIDKDFMPRTVKFLSSKNAVAMNIGLLAINIVGFAQRNWPRGTRLKRAYWAKLCYRYNVVELIKSIPTTIYHLLIIRDIYDAVEYCQTECIYVGFHPKILAEFYNELIEAIRKYDI